MRWPGSPGLPPGGWVLLMVLLAAAPICLAGTAADRPNIVVILSDDQGWGDLSLNGNVNLATPAIDSLARSGARFDRFYVSPVCSPTRAEFLTGRYHPRGGVHSTSTGGERLNLDEHTIAQTFKAAGYVTGAFGKWHNGTQYPYHPNARGFDEFYGFCSGHWGSYFDAPLDHNGKPVRGKGYLADDLTDHAMQFIKDHRRQPFFCYLPLNIPHSPMQVPERFYQKFAGRDLPLRGRIPAEEDLAFTRAALAMCENIDWNVGRVLACLDQLKVADRTVVLYFSDNGPNSSRWNGGMKGQKGSTDEGGVRSPLVMRWPGRIPAGITVSNICAAIDLLPTLADLAGIPVRSTRPLDGLSLQPLLLGAVRAWPDRLLFSHWNKKVSVRTQRYRLDAANRLFDMDLDPGQTADVASQHGTALTQLKAAADAWRAEMLPALENDVRPFTVGYREFPLTQLPARDGVPHGNVTRSATAPNCSYFEHWTSTTDHLTWDIEVATPGTYRVEALYACPQADTGSVVELSFLGRTLTAKVSRAHDPPLRGAENDRVKRRGESYVKDFKPLRLGEIDLPRGRGLLTLRALSIPGGQVMELRGLMLTLRD